MVDSGGKGEVEMMTCKAERQPVEDMRNEFE